MIFLGYKRDTLENFYNWQGYDGNPAEGTVNQISGYNTDNVNGTTRYTFPMIHKDSTCDYDEHGMPIIGTITGAETDVIYIVDDDCPTGNIPSDLMTQEEFDALDWINITYEM